MQFAADSLRSVSTKMCALDLSPKASYLFCTIYEVVSQVF